MDKLKKRSGKGRRNAKRFNKPGIVEPAIGNSVLPGEATPSATPPTAAFAFIKLHDATRNALTELGFVNPTAVQQACLPLMIEKHCDVVVQAPTGSGKTLAFVIPIFEFLHRHSEKQQNVDNGKLVVARHSILACILCPTQELALQIYDVVAQFLTFCPIGRAALWVGGHNIGEEMESFEANGASIIVATPGRIRDLLTRNDKAGVRIRAGIKHLEVLVFDEADRLLDMGFRPAIDTVLAAVPKQRRTALFSATQTKSVEDLVRVGMRNPAVIKISMQGSLNDMQPVAENLQTSTPAQLENFYKITSPFEKLTVLFEFLRERSTEKHLVFVPTCAMAGYLAMLLRAVTRDAVPVFELHRKLKHKRKQIFKDFSDVKCGVLIATDIVARGIDWPDISWVIQLDVPKTPSSFVHRCGRTARLGGLVGSTLLLLMPNEEGYVNFIQKNQNVQLKEAPWLRLPDAHRIAYALQSFRLALCGDRDLVDLSLMAFTSYVRAYGKHECALLCQVKELDLVSLAMGMGLVSLPIMPEFRGRDISEFSPVTNIDIATIKYKDSKKQRERERKLAVKAKQETDGADAIPPSADEVIKKNLGKRRWNERWSQSRDKRERRKERKLITKLKSANNFTSINQNTKFDLSKLSAARANDSDDDEDILAAKIAAIKQKRCQFLRATKPERQRKQVRKEKELIDRRVA